MEAIRRSLRGLFAVGLVVAAAAISIALVEDERGHEVAVALDPGSWAGLRSLVEDSGALAALQALDPRGGRVAVCVYPTTVGGLGAAGWATVASGADVLSHFRVEGMANLYAWEHVRRIGIRPDRAYVSTAEADLRDRIEAALRRRFGGDAVRAFRRDIPGNHVLEVDAPAADVRSAPLDLVPAEVGVLEENLIGAVLVVSTPEEAGLLADLDAGGPVRAVEFRAGATAVLHDPRVRGYLAALGLPVVLPPGVPAPAGVRSVPAVRVPPGASAAEVADLVRRTRARLAILRADADAAVVRALEEAGYRLGPPRPHGRARAHLVLPMLLTWPAFVAVALGAAGLPAAPVYVATAVAALALHVAAGPGAAIGALVAATAAAGGAWGLLRWEEAGPGDARLVEIVTVLSLTAATSLGAVGLAALEAPPPVAEERVLVLAIAVYLAAQFAIGVPPTRPARTGLVLAALALWTVWPIAGEAAGRLAGVFDLGRWGLAPRRLAALAGGLALYARVAHVGGGRIGLSCLAVAGQAAILLEAADPALPIIRRAVSIVALGAAGPAAGAAVHAACRWYLDRRADSEEDDVDEKREPDEPHG